MTIKMMEAETSVVLFACSGVEPREGQTLVVVGSSSELGGWDVSRSISLHRVKNPAFPSVWMSFPIRHSAGSEVRFQFALVTPSADTESLQSMTFDDRRLVVDVLKSSSAVISTISAAAPSHSRSQDCCWCVWGEPLGCGLREVEVVSGGYALFGGRWGNWEPQVSPLRLEDMVLAQQQLEPEKDTPPSVSSELEIEKENAREGGGVGGGGTFRGPPEGDLMVSDVTGKTDGALSQSFPICPSPKREGESGKERGCGSAVQVEDEFSARKSHVSQQTVGGVGVAPASENADILMVCGHGAECDGVCVPEGHHHLKTNSAILQRGGDELRGVRGGIGFRFAPAALNRRGIDRVNGGEGLSGGKSAETGGAVNLLAGRVGKSRSVSRESLPERECPSAVCDGPKRRRLSSLSVAISESQSDMSLRRGEQTLIFPCPSIPQQHSGFPKSRLSFDSVGMNQADVACQREAAVCGLSEEEETQRGSTNWGGNTTKATKRPLCPPDRCHSDCRGAERKHPVACNRDIQQQLAGRDGRTEKNGVRRKGEKREHTGEVKRDRHGNILCPHGRVRSACKECGGKSICEHGRERSRCKECGGKGICEHGRIRSRCKDCGVKGICEHGRRRSQCKDCGGKDICEHGRQRSKCKECGGKSICEHGRERYYCKACGGGAFCVHRRKRRYCQECKQVASLPP
uniref:CBM20 domain-containing protein n=1 Tax=Chromera velia CCMP2878 TaxID=1169474 RepID=A0A0G4HPK9_9ALVE|eukprot:Cvel_7792.t1-p1 / transcript=Cvel_7792.t1 / gene=Cvel_7792 / organism=Chromera_velia_CCMP2878 / gene_product=Zinc finger protein 283, putative / transcript_product=Zinc finger protein 283, putative / location=Cvel_scaffold415:54207-56267(+) / protein_length=687 / sequence_SO=supercontig / SO=protein_coding / is_pseudo=false